MKKETTTEKYLKEILELMRTKCNQGGSGSNTQFIPPYIYPVYGQSVPHYHDGMPCYQNPCVWQANRQDYKMPYYL